MACRAVIYSTLTIASFLGATLATGATRQSDPPVGFKLDSTGQVLLTALQHCPLPYEQATSDTGSQVQRSKVITTPDSAGFYPLVGRQLGLQAVIHVHFLIDALGNIRFPYIGYTLPFHVDPEFSAAAIRLTQSRTDG